MKIPALLLFLALAGLGACSSPEAREGSVEPSGEIQAMSAIPLQYASAADLANALRQLRPDARVFADGRTNSILLVCTSEADLRELSAFIAKLDVEVKGAK